VTWTGACWTVTGGGVVPASYEETPTSGSPTGGGSVDRGGAAVDPNTMNSAGCAAERRTTLGSRSTEGHGGRPSGRMRMRHRAVFLPIDGEVG
jgi:hypothetical protein